MQSFREWHEYLTYQGIYTPSLEFLTKAPKGPRQRRTFTRIETSAKPPERAVDIEVERSQMRAVQKAAGNSNPLAADTIPSGANLRPLPPRLGSSAVEQRPVSPLVGGSTPSPSATSGLPVQTTDSKSEDAGFDSQAPRNEADPDLDEARPEIDALINRIVWRRRMHGDDAKTLALVGRLEQLTTSLGYRVEGIT